jgi:hypothetical protein
MAAGTPYSARFAGPCLIPKGKDCAISVQIQHDGAAPTVTSAKFSLFDPSGTVLIDSQTAAESGGVISYTVLAAATTDQTYGSNYMIRFEVVIGGFTHLFNNAAAVVLAQLYPPIGTQDLLNRATKLAALQTTGESELQKYITAAWEELLIRLFSSGLQFWTIRSPGSLREWLTTRALSYALADLALVVSSGSGYRDEARRLERTLPGHFERIAAVMDSGEDNAVSEIKQPTAGVIQLSSGRGRWT